MKSGLRDANAMRDATPGQSVCAFEFKITMNLRSAPDSSAYLLHRTKCLTTTGVSVDVADPGNIFASASLYDLSFGVSCRPPFAGYVHAQRT
jgi:hypothetical protein